jgi:lysophospholipase L1-like esterase
MKIFAYFFAMLTAASLVPQKPEPLTIWMIGDSTMAKKETKAYPETGWGMPFSIFWDSSVTVENRAANGRSTKSFLAENRWQPLLDKMKPGDYVFIQFGHNDESKDKGERYSTPAEFKANLKKYITEARNKKAIPVLFTPVGRRKFDSNGHIMETHAEYAELVKQVGKENMVYVMDLNAKSKELYEEFGPINSKLLFNYVQPGEHPNYPEGKEDDTHFNELGARKIAQIVLQEIRDQFPELATRIRVVKKKQS